MLNNSLVFKYFLKFYGKFSVVFCSNNGCKKTV